MRPDQRNTVNFPGGSEELLKYLPDALRVPKDLPPAQAILSTGIKWASGGIIPIAAATKLFTYADPRKLMQTETLIAAWGGFAAESFKQIYGESPIGEFLAGLMGVTGPQLMLGILKKARGLATSAMGLRTEEDIQREIGGQLNKLATPDEMQAGVAKTEAAQKELGAEFKPTTGQAVGTPGLAQSERAFQRSSTVQADVGKRTLAQNQAVVRSYVEKGAPEGKLADTVTALESTRNQESAMLDASLIRQQAQVDAVKHRVSSATDRIVQQADERATMAEQRAQDRINALRQTDGGSVIREGDAGRILRQEYQAEKAAFSTEASAKYATVDPDGRIPVPTGPLRDGLAQFTDKWGVSTQGLTQAGLRKISSILPDLEKTSNDLASFKALHQARTEVRRLRTDAVTARDGTSTMQLGELDDLITDTLAGGVPGKVEDVPHDIAAMSAKPRGTLNITDNHEILLRAEKAKADLEAASGGGAGYNQAFDVGPGQGEKTTFQSAHADWYKDLTNPAKGSTGNAGSSRKTPLKPDEVNGAVDKIIRNHGDDVGPVVEQVKKSLLNDKEFPGSPWGQDFEKVARGEPPPWLKLDSAPDIQPDEIKSAYARLRDADSFYAKGAQRLNAGEAGALRFKNRWGRFVTHDEDVAAKFLEGETPVNDFVQALGSRPSAREALRDYAKLDFYKRAVNPETGEVKQLAAARWIQDHEDALKQFPELGTEFRDVKRLQAIATGLTKDAEAIARNPEQAARLRNPKVYGELDEVTRKQTDLLDLRERTVGEWQKGLTSQLMGLDADRAAGAIVRSAKPQTMIAELSKKIGSDADGQAGLTRALWDASLDKFSAQITDAVGNKVLKQEKMRRFLTDNEAWMTQRFGEERVQRMRTSINALGMLESTGRPVLPGGSDTMANLSSVLTDWGPFLSRLYAERSGRASLQWVLSERTARILGNLVKARTEDAAAELLQQAFYDPRVAQTFMLAAKNASEPLLTQRFRSLLPKSYLLADQSREDQP
jgi:hypothetical protein